MQKQDIVMETGKAAPAVIGTVYYGFTLQEWVAMATLAYIALQAAFLVWKWRRLAKRDKKR